MVRPAGAPSAFTGATSNCQKKFLYLYARNLLKVTILMKVIVGTIILPCICYKSVLSESFASMIAECGSAAAAAAAQQRLASHRPCLEIDSTSRRPCVARRWAWSSAAEVKGLAGRVAGRDRAKAAAAQACVGAARRSAPEELAPDRGCDGRLATVTALDHLSAEPFFQR